ncbi:4-fold beta flower protein [Roseibium sp. SCP14]|uniref:4-fold beta flower protein n=1 Tax=Roseibium sp. SCP14 TaxID=3141375 RepID=UPI0033395CFB
MDVYDREGKAVGYILDGYLLNWNGSPAAYIQNGAIYDLKKRHVGHVGDGWIRDRKGHAVAFFGEPSGGPMPPMKIRPPLKPVAPRPSLPPLLPIPPLAPIPTSRWSPFSLTDFLNS